MATSFEINVAANGRCDVRFPQQCVCCGAPPATETLLTMNRLITRKGRQSPLKVRLPVPHCQTCALANSWLFWIEIIPALLGFLLVGGAVFIAVFVGAIRLGLDNYGRPQDTPSLILGAFFGMLAGLAGGLVAEAITRLVLLPFLGRSMLRAPLFVVQFLTDTEYISGLQGSLAKNGAYVWLTFENDQIASEFAALNNTTPRTHRSPT